jgi:hypothetical protein
MVRACQFAERRCAMDRQFQFVVNALLIISGIGLMV